MTVDELIDFIEKHMRMSHVYQPLLIKALIESGGSATLRQLAQAFVLQDESQLNYYEERIKSMPVRVLKSHGVIDRQGELVTLNVPKLQLEEKARIKALCEMKLQEYVQKRGLGIWDHRLIDQSPVPDSLYYEVLKESGGRCALCGASKKDGPLEVDHIKPRSKGGKTTRENLQVLCGKCNRAKGNRDDTDFRQPIFTESVSHCPFCSPNVLDRIVEELESVIAIEDKFPVTAGHLLILPRRHTPDFFSMTAEERRHADSLMRILRERVSLNDSSVNGFNVGVNCGESGGQTMFHAHIHLIPRRKGDVDKPRGGVRGVIPEKMSY